MLLEARRSLGGGRERLTVQSPQGHQLLLEKDRSHAARKRCFHTSKMFAALRHVHPAVETTAQRFDQDNRQVTVLWDHAVAGAMGVGVAATMAGYHAVVAAAGPERAGPQGKRGPTAPP